MRADNETRCSEIREADYKCWIRVLLLGSQNAINECISTATTSFPFACMFQQDIGGLVPMEIENNLPSFRFPTKHRSSWSYFCGTHQSPMQSDFPVSFLVSFFYLRIRGYLWRNLYHERIWRKDNSWRRKFNATFKSIVLTERDKKRVLYPLKKKNTAFKTRKQSSRILN